MGDKIYVGKGKTKYFENGGKVINTNICLTDILENNQHVREYKGKKWVTLDLFDSKKVEGDYDIAINTWKPG